MRILVKEAISDMRVRERIGVGPNQLIFKQKASGSNIIEYKMGEIFGEIMNMILHGIEAPNILHTNTLTGKP
jgi:hypothetical protein